MGHGHTLVDATYVAMLLRIVLVTVEVVVHRHLQVIAVVTHESQRCVERDVEECLQIIRRANGLFGMVEHVCRGELPGALREC